MFSAHFTTRSMDPRLEELLAAIGLAAAAAGILTMNALPLLAIQAT